MSENDDDILDDDEDREPEWPPRSCHHLTELYNREYNRTTCDRGYSEEEGHLDACTALYKAGHPPPIMLKPTASGQTDGMGRGELCNRLGVETVRRAVYEGALRRIFEVVGKTHIESEDDPAQAALTEVYNICNFAIPAINGEEPEKEMHDTICIMQEEYRKLAHDAPHDDLGADLVYWTERHREIARDTEKKCEEAIKRREEAYRELDIALRRASRLERERDDEYTRCRMLERALDYIYGLLCKLSITLEGSVTGVYGATLDAAIEACKHKKEPELSNRFGQPSRKECS